MPLACMVEKPHLREDSGSIAVVVMQDSSKNVTAMDGAALRIGERDGSLLIDALMRTGGIIVSGVFSKYTE